MIQRQKEVSLIIGRFQDLRNMSLVFYLDYRMGTILIKTQYFPDTLHVERSCLHLVPKRDRTGQYAEKQKCM